MDNAAFKNLEDLYLKEKKKRIKKYGMHSFPLKVQSLDDYKEQRRIKSKLPKWNYKPSERVFKALQWLSRDKWLSPFEVKRIGFALSKIACPHAPHHVYKYATYQCSVAVGIFDGEPPFFPGEKNYSRWLKAIKNMNDQVPELALLKIFIRSNLK